MNRVIWLISGIFLLAAVIFGAIGICIGKSNRKKLRTCTVKTIAKVVGIERRVVSGNDSLGGVSYHPIFEYHTGNVCFKETCVWGNNPSHYQVGQEVVLCYNPDKPTAYLIENDKTSKVLNVVFTCVGALFLILSIVIPFVATMITA